ncbi:MAG: hypothetical protein ACD_67C00208G0002 [uncultured bacterium]|nr:MAG: hypothetical protein ACD_67C00208G0002 [uncultured bacterium]
MQNPATIKRILVSIVFVLIFSVTAFVLYLTITPDPTCFDGKKNQAEKAVDCGGTCAPCVEAIQTKPLTIEETAVVFGGNNTYDAVAKIINPNDSVGASSFKYTFNLKDSSGNVVATRQGTNFILPADSKYVVDLGFQFENGGVPTSAEFVINDVAWEKLSDIGKPQIGVYRKNFGKTPTGNGNEADGIIRNESGYDLNKIFIAIVLRNEDGEIIGVNKTEKNFVRTKAEIEFRLNWPYQFSAPVAKMDVDAQANIFDRENFTFSL